MKYCLMFTNPFWIIILMDDCNFNFHLGKLEVFMTENKVVKQTVRRWKKMGSNGMIYFCLSDDHFGSKYYRGIWICCKVHRDDDYLNDNTGCSIQTSHILSDLRTKSMNGRKM
jgi:hypothetical protein